MYVWFESGLGKSAAYEVGFFMPPSGEFCSVMATKDKALALRLVNYLNGGDGHPCPIFEALKVSK